jgi:hypothetical protein
MVSAEDKTAAKKISGWLIPAYAMAVLVLVVVMAVANAPRNGELVASSAAPAATR